MSVTEEIKQRLDIVDLVSQYVPLKKAGRNFKAQCPFHTERTPSFIVFPDQQTWHCFGACGTGGDIFTFVMKKENVDFAEALQQLAARAGVELHRGNPDADRAKKLLIEIMGAAAERYHYLLKNAPAAQFARDYLARRQVKPETVELFQLGFAPNEFESTRNFLVAKQYAIKDIEAAGLIIANASGNGYHDRFRGRLMFPIRNRAGEVIAFGARALQPDEQPKYLNSPDTPLFSKSSTLYGLDLAKDAIRAENLAIIVEGYLDVIIAHQAGFKNVVASLGTALTEKQLGLMKRMTKRFALALDADAAGNKATDREFWMALDQMPREATLSVRGRGLIEFEDLLDAEFSTVELPAGRDPDEVILSDPEQWKARVAAAKPIVDHMIRSEAASNDLSTWQGRETASDNVAKVIAGIVREAKLDYYIREAARELRIDERVMRQKVDDARKGTRSKVARPSGGKPGAANRQDYFLGLAMLRPDLLPRVSFLQAEDFPDAGCRAMFAELTSMAATGPLDPEELCARLPEPLQDYGRQVLADAQRWTERWGELSDEEIVRSFEVAALRLQLQRYQEESARLAALQQEVEEAEERRQLMRQANELYAQMAGCQKQLQARTLLSRSSKLHPADIV